MPYPKRLIEVDLPIKRISAHSRREKSIRHGHVSTMHIWWARRPLAACRAVILAALWPDPADERCPEPFRKEARKRMLHWARECAKKASPESFERLNRVQREPATLDNPIELRKCLLDFIADSANWDNSNDRDYLEMSRALVRAAHEALGGAPGTRPLVVDPFAGGGSIPLEALRVGADAFASDLNPIAVLLNKVVLEYVPKFGQRLASEVRNWGEWVKKEAEKELAEFYPRDSDLATPIAYLWARTIQCEGPGCGAEVPILPSLWLEKGKRSVAYQLSSGTKRKGIDVAVLSPAPRTTGVGTAKSGAVTCPACGYTTPVTSTRRQLSATGGGAASARLLAVVTVDAHGQRVYRAARPHDTLATEAATLALSGRSAVAQRKGEMSPVPSDILPLMSGVFNVPLYGHQTWGSLFTPRQALMVSTLAGLVRGLSVDGTLIDDTTRTAVCTCLALAVDRQADYSTAICTWVPSGGFIGHTFAQGQSLPIKFDFAESAPFADGSGSWAGAVDWVARVIEYLAASNSHPGQVSQASATRHPLPDDAAHLIVTDPPYYNAVPYADLSDFFYVWLKRTVGPLHPELFADPLATKDEEICEMAGWDPIRYPHKTGAYFEDRMRAAMAEARRVLGPSGIATVVFAHKTTGGWEALLQAMVDAGWVLTASWPIDTERSGRLRAMGSAALASSIHLVCRPRENADGSVRVDAIGDWRDVLAELPRRIHEWMPRLAEEGVVGADAIFACLGPALEIFSSHSRVEKASGEQVTLKEYLENVWAAVAKEALSMIFEGAETSGFEEDARLTAMWLWTLSAGRGNGKAESIVADSADDSEDDEDDAKASKKAKIAGFSLEYDAARKIAQGLGAHLDDLRSLVEVKGETARLLPVAERTRALFGKSDGDAPATRRKRKAQQMKLGFAEELEEAEESGGWGQKGAPKLGDTVLDRVHQSMILFAAGRGEALRRFLVDEAAGRDARFWRLAQALAALYPTGTDERRWVEGVLARKKGLGF